ncbi:MAG: twin-arginine translocase TatA/TatE family subunit [Pseudomonadota bacterium]|nr:twin-arginine translocase TatA/TatE family subunit [Pseudomonadota bacterium]
MFGLSPWELIIILAIVLLLFGGKRLKNLGGDLGASIKGFKKAMSEDEQKPSIQAEDAEELEKARKKEAEK